MTGCRVCSTSRLARSTGSIARARWISPSRSYSSMVANAAMTGRDGIRLPALPHDPLRDLLSARGVLG